LINRHFIFQLYSDDSDDDAFEEKPAPVPRSTRKKAPVKRTLYSDSEPEVKDNFSDDEIFVKRKPRTKTVKKTPPQSPDDSGDGGFLRP